MRITYVSHALPPYEFAGTPIYTLNIAKAQAAAGHDVSVFARLEDLDLPAYRMHDESRDGLRIRFVNRPIDWSSLDRSYIDDRMKKVFGEFLDEMRPEVVHFQHILGMGVGCVAAVAERGIKSVMTLNDFWTMCPMGQRVCYTDFQICDPIDFGKCGPCVFGAGWQDPGSRHARRSRASRRAPRAVRVATFMSASPRLPDGSRGGRERCSGRRDGRWARCRGASAGLRTPTASAAVAQPVHRPLRGNEADPRP